MEPTRQALATLLSDWLSAGPLQDGERIEAQLTSVIADYFSFVPPGAVDRERGIVRGVCVLGARSDRNGVKYPHEVTARHAPMYAVPVNIQHHSHPVTTEPVAALCAEFGRLVDPRPVGGALYADHHFDPAHPFADEYCSACEKNPTRYSFSPHHRVLLSADRDADGDFVALSILEVASVDIVEVGSTTVGIFLPRTGAS